ncbi:MAG: acyltransferase [Bacteroidetes bacterium]|nr:acyltransferase [Bacteroidota bacterium]
MQDLAEQQKPVFFPTLDVLRFIAAFGVVIAHGFNGMTGGFGNPSWLIKSPDAPQELNMAGMYAHRFATNLSIGVDLFFLISGFLITYLLIREKDKTGTINIPKFYIRRALRIWPLYFFLILCAPLLLKWLDVAPYKGYLWQATFMSNFRVISENNFEFPFAHFWSISVEEHFYLFWPLLLFFVPVRKMPVAFAAVIFASFLYRLYAMIYIDLNYFHFYLNTFARMDEMAIGGWIGWLYFQKKIELRIPGFVRFMAYAGLIILLMLEHRFEYTNPIDPLFRKYIYIGFMLFVFADFLFNTKFAAKMQKPGLLHYLGKISFGMYMYHNMLIAPISMKIMPAIGSANKWVFASIYLSLTTLIAALSYELFEKRILKFKDKFAIIATRRS